MNHICEECKAQAKYAIKNLNPESNVIFSLYYCGECIDTIDNGSDGVVMEL